MAVLSLGEMVNDLRMEVGHSTNPATGLNMRDQLVYLLNRSQEELNFEYDWPGLVIDRDVPIEVGARYYEYPSDLPFDNVENMWLVWNTLYQPVEYGIGPEQFALFNSITGFTSFPVERWMHNQDQNLFELWPVPSQAPVATSTSQAALVRLRGTRLIPRMVQDADVCVLPATPIILYAAADMLARMKAADASLKLAKAKEYVRRLRLRQRSNKERSFVMGGGAGADGNSMGRIGLDYIPIGYGSGPNS